MNDFNNVPVGLKEITQEDFYRLLYSYQTKQKQIRQVRGESPYNLVIFQIDTDFVSEDIGVAIMDDYWDCFTGKARKNSVIRFCRYGHESNWNIFLNKFAAQFAGDNS